MPPQEGDNPPRWGDFSDSPRPGGGNSKKIDFRSPHPDVGGDVGGGILGGTFWTIFATVWVFLAPQARFLANVDHFLAFRRHFKGIWRHFFSNLQNFLENIYYFRSTPKNRRGGDKKFISVPLTNSPHRKHPPIGEIVTSWTSLSIHLPTNDMLCTVYL